MRYVICFLLILLTGTMAFAAEEKLTMTPENFLQKVTWWGQACIRIETDSGKTIYFDPFNLAMADPADYVLLTHSHQDHLNAQALPLVVGEKTKIIAPATIADALVEMKYQAEKLVAPGDELVLADFTVEVVPAYNVEKTRFHPKENNWVGYILTVDGVRIYHAGDTERIPEMKEIDCDIAFLPLGQTYTMNSVEEAAQAAADVKAEIAVPMHYGLYEGTADDAQKFKDLLHDTINVVVIPPKGVNTESESEKDYK